MTNDMCKIIFGVSNKNKCNNAAGHDNKGKLLENRIL